MRRSSFLTAIHTAASLALSLATAISSAESSYYAPLRKIDNRQVVCVKGFADISVAADGPGKTHGLKVGDEVFVKVADETEVRWTVYLGESSGANGDHHVILANPVTGVRYQVSPPSETAPWKNHKTGEVADVKLPGRWFAEVPKNTDGTCAAHAAADCAVSFGDTLNAMSPAAAELYRRKVYAEAKDIFYGNRWDDGKIPEFFKSKGFIASAIHVDTPGEKARLLAHLHNRKPVFFVYGVRQEAATRTTVTKYAGGESEWIENARRIVPAASYAQTGRHAVAAVGLVERSGHEPWVIVFDSSDDGMQLWSWSDFTNVQRNPDTYHVLLERAANQ